MSVIEIDPATTSRAYAFEYWLNAPMPMVTFFKTLNITPLLKFSKKAQLKFNMLLCWCIGLAAMNIKEFYLLPVNNKLLQYKKLAVNTIVRNSINEVSSCDIPFSPDLNKFNRAYIHLTRDVFNSCKNNDISSRMVIGTSNLAQYDIDGAVGMYSGIYNNPFIIWGKYKRNLFKTYLKISFQFHHTQMDGAHACKFLDNLQSTILAL